MKKYDERHGGPWDRGSADAYYRRPFSPHYFTGGTYATDKITDLSPEELEAYEAGYEDQIEAGDFKDYGDDE